MEKPANSLIRMPQNALKALLEDVPTRVLRSLMFIVLTNMSALVPGDVFDRRVPFAAFLGGYRLYAAGVEDGPDGPLISGRRVSASRQDCQTDCGHAVR